MSESYGDYEARLSANHKPGTLRRLQCCCCGEDAGRWHQWWNRDTGYGVCLRCVTWFRQDERETEDEIKDLYGVEGVNWGAIIEANGHKVRAVACFEATKAGEDKANAWMAKNPTHALLATQDGYYWLADVNDKGEE